jgi:hypothetical protein
MTLLTRAIYETLDRTVAAVIALDDSGISDIVEHDPHSNAGHVMLKAQHDSKNDDSNADKPILGSSDGCRHLAMT